MVTVQNVRGVTAPGMGATSWVSLVLLGGPGGPNSAQDPECDTLPGLEGAAQPSRSSASFLARGDVCECCPSCVRVPCVMPCVTCVFSEKCPSAHPTSIHRSGASVPRVLGRTQCRSAPDVRRISPVRSVPRCTAVQGPRLSASPSPRRGGGGGAAIPAAPSARAWAPRGPPSRPRTLRRWARWSRRAARSTAASTGSA